MEHGDYIRRFAVAGQHSCYPILVHKFEITQGEPDLNAIESKSPLDLTYFDREYDGEHGVERSAAQERSENREKRKKQADNPLDLRHGSFLEFARASFEGKHGHPPTWDCFGKDGKELAAFLRRAPHVTLDVFQTHISSFVDSTEPFQVKQGGSLSYFVRRFATFAAGPIYGERFKAAMEKKPVTSSVTIPKPQAVES